MSGTTRRSTRRVCGLAATCALGSALVLGACSGVVSDAGDTAAAAVSTDAAGTGSPSASPPPGSDSGTGGASSGKRSEPSSPARSSGSPTSPPPSARSRPHRTDPLAPKRYTPVIRGHGTPQPRFSAPTRAFGETARYPDGVTLRVLDVRHGAVTGQGPGYFPGDPTTTLKMRLRNGTDQRIDLSSVVVTAVHGDPRRLARPVYGKESSDFHGSAVPGRTSTGTYTFSIPTADLDDVTVWVDFDGRHTAATFVGSVQ